MHSQCTDMHEAYLICEDICLATDILEFSVHQGRWQVVFEGNQWQLNAPKGDQRPLGTVTESRMNRWGGLFLYVEYSFLYEVESPGKMLSY